MRVGIAGVGKMGAAIALRLMEVGHEVTVWNRSADRTKPLAEAGAKVAASPKALAESVETIITILGSVAAYPAVYEGSDGVAAADLSGKLVIDMTTVSRLTSRHWRRSSGPKVQPSSSVRLAAQSGRRARANCWDWLGERPRISSAPSRCLSKCAGALNCWGRLVPALP
ncbi:MAG: NAD(P)-binding domain-containing protein [Hyphomicrobiaceae bacterium]